MVLSSVHQAKGLEWRAVFVVWLADGRFPSAQALKDRDGEEEERRLFYVACTRAKDELYLAFPLVAAPRDRERVVMKASRFLEELPGGAASSSSGGSSTTPARAARARAPRPAARAAAPPATPRRRRPRCSAPSPTTGRGERRAETTRGRPASPAARPDAGRRPF